jgi:O-antigen/teichoic acid export membrane protein
VSANWRSLAGSDTGRAAGMAVAVVLSNTIGLAFTIVFANGDAGASVTRWLERLALATVVVAALAIPLRELIATIVNVEEDWAAAAVPVSGMLWAFLSVERGALQGFGRYRLVALSVIGEATTRLLFALALVGVGLDVTGAFMGTALSLVAMGLALSVPLRRCLPPAGEPAAGVSRLRDLLVDARVPVAGLTLLFAIQELHVIVVKHEASADAAGAYAVAAVAAKSIIWVAVGLGLYLVPEAARRSEAGADARPILLRTLGLIVVFSAPALLIFGLGAEPLLSAAFGEDLTQGATALPWLGLAMAFLACTYLSVQYLLALGRTSFIWVLALAAALEVALVAEIGADLHGVALALCGLQLACTATILTVAYRDRVRAVEHAAA